TQWPPSRKAWPNHRYSRQRRTRAGGREARLEPGPANRPADWTPDEQTAESGVQHGASASAPAREPAKAEDTVEAACDLLGFKRARRACRSSSFERSGNSWSGCANVEPDRDAPRANRSRLRAPCRRQNSRLTWKRCFRRAPSVAAARSQTVSRSL